MIADQSPALSLADLEAFNPKGGQGRGAETLYQCPICKSDERALHVNQQTGLWNCKRASCGAKGKLKDFWQDRPKLHGREYSRQALRRALEIETPPKSEPSTAATWRDLWEASQPIAATPGAEYLAGRGIPEWVATAAGVHYSPNLRARASGGPAVLFPFEYSGAPVAFAARYIDGKSDGHRAMGQKSAGVFLTAPGALQRKVITLCEAPADALSLATCGLQAIALGGTVAPEWLPKACAFKRVLLAFDNDENGAGDEAAQKLRPILESFGATVARLTPYRHECETKSDWNAMLEEHGVKFLHCHLRDELEAGGVSNWLPIGRAPRRSSVFECPL
jgi:putative DNA primase/helicase